MEAHRILGLALHAACALALYKLIFDLQQYAARRAGAPPGAGLEAHAPAFIAAAVFAIHPVAVYGAGYLIQRSIGPRDAVFPELDRAVSCAALRAAATPMRSPPRCCTRVAVLSKEHAVLLPARPSSPA